ncbi:IMP-specific 5'-nucleotidase-like protein 1 [Mollisia scopiformis]|uniref:IMP-specific 5'-nucleotidase 1 n=1 Tax=Mollisia scopiformis TaxID=149040 RepID=A0A132BBN5_MOLSC|nr:IMP-specific 5'-nucleotidase-like protein 1 [Mollisia scopiformis]KUJ09254.1 IMP-specific 5'-nucleotidase-like protein 1 [Mollisia scopiformis]
MTTRYRVEYALKTHRRDQFIEWIKALLAVPFVLHSQPTGVFETASHSVEQMAAVASRRYEEIMLDVEQMIDDHIEHQKLGTQGNSKLKLLVPSIGTFFTRLPLAAAFRYQDKKRFISSRRFVPPSFNDVRLILNTAQLMGVTTAGNLELATFDGDVTLYDDGKSLEADNPVIQEIIQLMSHDTKIGIVTAAGYTEAERYYGRLHGLLEAIKSSDLLTNTQKHNLVVMGGESNFLFKFSMTSPYLLTHLSRRSWILPSMSTWTQARITSLLDLAEFSLKECVTNLSLPATILRKERAVGIIPKVAGYKFPRESLEETVMVVQKKLDMSEVGKQLPFCAFNGGNDVFVDIGDKSWGVLVCQNYFGTLHHGSGPASRTPSPSVTSNEHEQGKEERVKIEGERTLHVGDQFLSAGSNDFKARVVGTTAWIASPAETVELLAELKEMIQTQDERRRGEGEAKMTRDTINFIDELFKNHPMKDV